MTTVATEQPARLKRRRSRKYSAAPLAVVPDEADLGPAMLALTPRQRKFVMELKCGPAGYGSEIRACRAAGYGNARSSDASMRVRASKVLHHPKTQAALCEVGHKIIRGGTFKWIENTAAIANDLTHRDCLRANLALLDRAGFSVETHHTVTVERSPATVAIATEQILERIRLLTAKLCLEPKQIEASPIEAEHVSG